MFKPKRGKSTISYIEERPLIFMAAAAGEYYQQPFQVRLSASVCGSHHFSVVQDRKGREICSYERRWCRLFS